MLVDVKPNPYCCGANLMGFPSEPLTTKARAKAFTAECRKKAAFVGFTYMTQTSRQINKEVFDTLIEEGWLLLAESKSNHDNYPIYHFGYIWKPYDRRTFLDEDDE